MSLDAILIAGANGVGKTTFARQFLPVQYPDAEFLNSDEIQREEIAFTHRVAAGREFLRRLSDLEQRRRSLAIEITLSSRMYVKRLRGFRVHWPNNSQSTYRRTEDGIEMTNCSLDLKNDTVSLFVDLYAQNPSQFSPLVEHDADPIYTKLEGCDEPPTWLAADVDET